MGHTVGLTRILRGIRDEVINVEMKNNENLIGVLNDVDKSMNLNLSCVSVLSSCGDEKAIDSVSIRGGSIRKILLRDSFNVDRELLSGGSDLGCQSGFKNKR